MRSGVIFEKLGMTSIFDDASGERVAVTVLKLEECRVLAQKTKDKHGYTALQLGVGYRKKSRVKKPQQGLFIAAGVEPKRKIAEFRVSEDNFIEIGAEILADHFVAGQWVDVTGESQGKGFQGVMRRWNFGGLRASHGVSISHRSHGSTGQRQDPGKVFKGKKMAGHGGCERVTVQNLKVVSVDRDKGLLFVHGAVPGPKGGWIFVRDAIKQTLPDGVPVPGSFRVLESTQRDSVQ